MTVSIATYASSAGLVVGKSSLVLGLGWGATRLLHRGPASARHAVWLVAIAGALAIPALDQFSPVSVHVLPAEALSSVARRSATTNTELALSTRETIQTTTVPAAAAIATTASRTRPSLGWLIASTWAAVAALMLFRLVLGALAVARITRSGHVIDAPIWIDALSAAAQRVQFRALPRLVMSDEVEMAFAFEAISPVIVLPAGAREWSHECRDSVLLHELAHLRRRDLIGQLLAGVAVAVNWFNPLMWVAARRLRVESELACDDVVLGAGVQPSEYAQHLLDMVTSCGRRTPAIAMAMVRRNDFEGRLTAILDPGRRPSPVARRRGVVAAGVVGLSAISIGAAVPVREGASTERVSGIAFQAASSHVAMAVESAPRRGRLDVLAIDSAAPVLQNGIDLAPLGGRGDYYLFDSTSFVLVRPASKTFAVFGIVDAAYNFNNGREGWPYMFEIPASIRTQRVSAAERAKRQLERHGAFHIYWHVDVEIAHRIDPVTGNPSRPSFDVVSRGRLGVGDAPLGESTVARWFEPALALAQLATVDSTWFPNDRFGLAAVAPLVGDDGATTNFMSQNQLARVRIIEIDLARLTLPSDYTAVAIAGSLTESQATERIKAWKSPPRAR